MNEGEIQYKLREVDIKINELQNLTKTQQIKIETIKNKLDLIESNIDKFKNINNFVKPIEEKLFADSNEKLKREFETIEKLIINKIEEYFDRRLQEKLKLFEEVAKKSVIINSKVLNYEKNDVDIKKSILHTKYETDILRSLLLEKKVITEREYLIIKNKNKFKFKIEKVEEK